MDAPLPPPAYGYLDDDKAAAANPLEFVLIQKFAYFANRKNATTASCKLQGPGLNGSIKVTFCVAAPPKVSYFCVHASRYSHSDFDLPPTILAAEGPLVLLRAILPCTSDICNTQTTEYFVYDASTNGKKGRRPSLKHLPSPGHCYKIQESSVALLRRCINHSFDATSGASGCSGFSLRPHGASQEDHCCDACGYVIAARRCSLLESTPHDLCLYHSVPGTCSMKKATAPGNAPYYHHCTHKAVVIGGDNGLVAWVDLEHDILFCDVLAESPTIRPVNLPKLITASKGVATGDPRSSRDVTVVNGFIKYTQLQIRIVPGSFTADHNFTYNGWKAATWSLPIGTDSSLLAHTSWRKVFSLDSSDCYKLVPNVQVGNDIIESKRIHIGLPVLSLQEDNIVYFLAMIDYRDREACVLAVDMLNKTVLGIAEFGAKNTIGFFGAYIPSRISKFFRISPGTKQKQKRRGQTLLGSSSKKQPGVSTSTDLGGAEMDFMALG